MRSLFLVAALLSLSACGTFRMSISRAELQAEVAGHFPVEVDKHVVIVRLRDPAIEFPGQPDRVGVRIATAMESGIANLDGDVRVEGRLEYVASEHAIFLRDPVVTDLHVHSREHPDHELGHRERAFLQVADGATRRAIEEVLRHRPVYRFDPSRSEREARAARHVRSMHIEGDELVLEVGL